MQMQINANGEDRKKKENWEEEEERTTLATSTLPLDTKHIPTWIEW